MFDIIRSVVTGVNQLPFNMPTKRDLKAPDNDHQDPTAGPDPPVSTNNKRRDEKEPVTRDTFPPTHTHTPASVAAAPKPTLLSDINEQANNAQQGIRSITVVTLDTLRFFYNRWNGRELEQIPAHVYDEPLSKNFFKCDKNFNKYEVIFTTTKRVDFNYITFTVRDAMDKLTTLTMHDERTIVDLDKAHHKQNPDYDFDHLEYCTPLMKLCFCYSDHRTWRWSQLSQLGLKDGVEITVRPYVTDTDQSTDQGDDQGTDHDTEQGSDAGSSGWVSGAGDNEG
ncbi:hypothetical protein LTR62_006560 [Meristemomyces frigidus]|uniref:Uncharacterized protein n=1 Tax=Meristemomyces frigidus TaxID=1508187 RepID=A0AAN7TCL3_9PEZI|nr:hypothetical protein LTR62_006560 [Meristemomyces frigidus]